MREPSDGKIRIRCTGCGKRVKFPKGLGGETFRCPVCHKTIVAPLDNKDAVMPTKKELKKAVAHAPKSPPPARTAAKQAAPAPAQAAPAPAGADDLDKHLRTIERITAFLARETAVTVRDARDMLADASLSEEETIAEIRQLRHDRAVRLNKFTQAVLEDLKAEIEKLENNPAAETESVRRRLDPLLEERRALLLYLKAMFELRSPSAAPAGAKDTRASASAPPSTPSPQDSGTP